MAKSVASVDESHGEAAGGKTFENQLRDAITESREQVRAMSPAARLGWLGQALTELGLDTKCLAAARELAATEQQLSRRLYERQQQAAQHRQEALKALADYPAGDLDGPVTSMWLRVRGWMWSRVRLRRLPLRWLATLVGWLLGRLMV